MSAGKFLYHFYHAPLGKISDCVRSGGPWEQWKTESGRRAMGRAAARLPVLPPPAADAPCLHLLTGRRFWYQTAFCIHSWTRAAGLTPRVELVDDGSLVGECREILEQMIPQVRILSSESIRKRLDKYLPLGKYPHLRERWEHYPNLRKLTDVHLGQEGWKLVLDSDLLFFRKPDFLIAWLKKPERHLHAVDCEESYGYSRKLLERLCGKSLPEKLNVGLCGLRSEAIDWDQLEAWTRVLIEEEGTHYYLEQALVAMMCAGRECAVAPASDYVTLPLSEEALQCRAVMHHYVADSKKWYFRENWRKVSGGL